MHISAVTITGFRCFGLKPVTIRLDAMTAAVGGNGCGKSALLCALVRLFGPAAGDRTLMRSDFHLPKGVTPDSVKEAHLEIEARIDFPELAEGKKAGDGVALCFGHMAIRAKGEVPYCRIRLEGTWRRSSTTEGDIDQNLWWIVTPNKDATATDKQRVSSIDRAKIHAHYVPATRDAVRQLRQVSGSVLHSILRAVNWSKDISAVVEKASSDIQTAFENETGVVKLQEALTDTWTQLQTDPAYATLRLRPIGKRLEDLVKRVEATFLPGAAGEEEGIDRLSDGLKSLFYFSIVAAAFDIRSSAENSDQAPFSVNDLDAPLLTLFAVEEPENHVAPHHLGRITALLRRLSEDPRAQVILSSHSPSILSRVEPKEVRYHRLDINTRCAVVKELTMPTDTSAFQYVREAVRAYPELYFSKAVILGEGDSEEIVLPRLAAAADMPLDRNLVSLVPLGGRHVHYFWDLLYDLGVPFVTLLDLDLGREGGGWGRIKYALRQLLEANYEEKQVLTVEGGPTLTRADLKTLHKRLPADRKDKDLVAWLKHLRELDVFFASPLDLDFAMLKAFPDAYQAIADRGPRIPEDEDEKSEATRAVTAAVLSDAAADTTLYTDAEKELLFWYRYLFGTRSKPATHMEALANIKDADLATEAPGVLTALLSRVKDKLVE